jgi:hypothetical protein
MALFMAWQGLIDRPVLRFGPIPDPNRSALIDGMGGLWDRFAFFLPHLWANTTSYWLFHRGAFQPGTWTDEAYGLTDASLIGHLWFGNEVPMPF